MEKRIPQQGEGNHIISAVMDDEQVVTTLEAVPVRHGHGYLIFDIPMTGAAKGERFIRAFAYVPEIAQGSFYRITGVTVPMHEITGAVA